MHSWIEGIGGQLVGDDAEEFGLATSLVSDISLRRGARRVVDLDALAHNYAAVSARVQKSIIAVVKARAYGSGLVPVAERLAKEGNRAFAVATLGAGLALRKSLADENISILVLGYVTPDVLDLARQASVAVSITDLDVWPAYKDVLSRTTSDGIKFHINVDTGMTRAGVAAWLSDNEAVLNLAQDIAATPGAILEGIYTHFPLAEELRAAGSEATDFTLKQIETVRVIVSQLRNRELYPRMVHIANSPAIEQYPEAYNQNWITHVRPGSLLHGLAEREPALFRRTTRWEAGLVRVEKLQRDVGIGYGHTFKAVKGQWIGTLPVGYADGYLNPVGTHRNFVRINGVAVPVVGRVAMDMCMIDLEPYYQATGEVPQPHEEVVVELMSAGPAGDLLSPENIGRRWGVGWPVVLSGIRTRNARVYEGTKANRH